MVKCHFCKAELECADDEDEHRDDLCCQDCWDKYVDINLEDDSIESS